MDKTSFFFTANCGVCHPGSAAMQYDRTGAKYFDRDTGLYGYGGGVATLPPDAQLDGDYGFINPSTGVPGTANWAKTGGSEADCLLCHMTQSATGPGTANHNGGLSWHKRAGTLRGTSVAGVANFEWAPTAGAGWASLSYVAGQSPPMASAVTIDYSLGLTAGTLVNSGGNLAIPLAKIGAVRDANCRGCHATPDGKKAGRTLLPTTDAHVAKGVGCTRCHQSSDDGSHQIGKGDITIGSVRNDLDNTVQSCTDCHVDGADAAAPNPTTKHSAIPGYHFSFMKCQTCHVRHLDDDGLATPTQDIPEVVIEMTSNGTQNSSIWSAYLGTDPVDPSRNLPELVGKPFRWYPAIRWYKGKLTTVKPLFAAWFGEWVGGTGDGAVIRPYPLRLVRKALTGAYAPGSPRLASLALTPGTKVASGAPILHKREEIRASLLAVRDATDTANPDGAANDIAVRPVLVRADKVYFLNASDEVEYFESLAGETHDFAVNHNVVAKRDPANPVVNPGPYGAGGCNDCHGPNNAFFFGKHLAEPAQYDFLDEHGTVPNPEAGMPLYSSQYEHLGYTEFRAKQLSAMIVPVRVQASGAGTKVTFGESGGDPQECRSTGGACELGATPGATVTFTAVGTGTFLGWTGCTPGADPLTCTAVLPTPASGTSNGGILVRASFGDTAPPPSDYALSVSFSGTGTGSVSGVTWDGGSCGAGPAGCTATIPNGATVTLHAQADSGSQFRGWGVVCTGTGDCSFKMNSAKSVVARFDPDGYALTVTTAGTGTGTVSDGAQISCTTGSTAGCSGTYANGASVTLSATWDSSRSVFKGWSGGVCSGTAPTCVVAMTYAKGVWATFEPAAYPLKTTVAGAGTVTGPGVACTSTAGTSTACTVDQPNGATVVLTAAPASSATVFKGWSGCSSVSGDTCTVKMTAAKSVLATFEPATFSLTLSLSGTGSGSVTGVEWASCTTGGCSAQVANGQTVTLTAAPSVSSTFQGWGIVCTGTGTCSFKMNAAKTVSAKFNAATASLP